MPTNFADILDQPADAVKAPALLPPGTYSSVVVGLPESGSSSQKQTPFFRFTHRITGAHEDVNETDLEEAFPNGLDGKEITNTFYLTENSAFMLVDFLKNCGIDTEGKTIRAMVDEVPNAEVGIVVKHEPSQDGTRIFARVARTIKLD